MSEAVTTHELNIQEQNQDCGCGGGGDSCSTHRRLDCGCGCVGDSCGGWQGLVWVESPRLTEVKQQAASLIP